MVFGFSFFVLFGFRFLLDLSAIDLENVAAKRQTYLEECNNNKLYLNTVATELMSFYKYRKTDIEKLNVTLWARL